MAKAKKKSKSTKSLKRKTARRKARRNPWMKTKEGRKLKVWWRKKSTAAKFLEKRAKALGKSPLGKSRKKPKLRSRVGRRTYQSAMLMVSGKGHIIKPRRRSRRAGAEAAAPRESATGGAMMDASWFLHPQG